MQDTLVSILFQQTMLREPRSIGEAITRDQGASLMQWEAWGYCKIMIIIIIMTSSAFYFKQISLASYAKHGLTAREQGAKAGDQVLNYCSLINIEHLGETGLQQRPVIKRPVLVGLRQPLGFLLTKL